MIKRSVIVIPILEGRVTDENRVPIPMCPVEVGGRVIMTDNEGKFSIELPKGKYSLKIKHPAYWEVSRKIDLSSDFYTHIILRKMVE